MEEYFDILTENGEKTGQVKSRKEVHRCGDWHSAVHVWIINRYKYDLRHILPLRSKGEVLIQKRASCKDSWPDLWDIGCAGHISAGDTSLDTACKELHEELGVELPASRFEFVITVRVQSISNHGAFINNEFDDVYIVHADDFPPLQTLKLQADEVGI